VRKLRELCKWVSIALLALVTLAALASSAWRFERWWWTAPSAHYLGLQGGQITIAHESNGRWTQDIRVRPYPFGFAGSFSSEINLWGWRYTIPLWPLIMLLAAVATWLWWLDDFGISTTSCLRCGYDLRARTGNRCPECGADMNAPFRGRWLGSATPRSIRALQWGGAVVSALVLVVSMSNGAGWWFEISKALQPNIGSVKLMISVPFWLPLALVAGPTLWLWWKADALIARRGR
jgi:hypothetical protein